MSVRPLRPLFYVTFKNTKEITIYDKEGLRDKPSLIKHIQNSRPEEYEYPGWCWWPEDCMFQHFFIHTYISQFCKFTNYYILKSFLL